MKSLKKGAADLIAIVVSVVIVGALAIGVLTFFSTKFKKTSDTQVNALDSKINSMATQNLNAGVNA